MKLACKEFIECLENNPNHAYDCIANNAWAMSKDELTDVCKELIYGIIDYETKRDAREILKNVSEELNDLWSEENE